MRTIEALEKEISMQLDFLQTFSPPKKLPKEKVKKAIFCGTGDSFAASQLAEVFSNFRARAHDPLDLLKNRQVLARHSLYLISVSGNTVSNIKLANLCKSTTAITAGKESRLANACKDLILLKFPSAGVQTAGSISFLASALTCISLVTKYRIKNVARIWHEAKSVARHVSLSGKIYILGNLHTLPVAVFCAAKLYEVLGADAHYERIEQFSHMGLFSARRGDTVLLFEAKNKHNEKLVGHLRKCGLLPKRIGIKTRNLQEQVLFFILVSELVALYGAKKKKKKDCFFIEENELRSASSSMIY